MAFSQVRECWYCGCPETARAIHMHHVEKRSLRPDLKADPDNLCPLCWLCHSRTESDHKFYLEIKRLWKRRNMRGF